MRFEQVERIADAVMYEGYVLYPYRASARKNQVRWQFGVLAPRCPEGDDGEPWFSQTQCLVEQDRSVSSDATLSVRVRFLRPGVASSGDRDWLEGVPKTVDFDAIKITPAAESTVDLDDVHARLCIRLEPLDRLTKVSLRLENLEPWRSEFSTNRNAMLRRSMVGAHLLLASDGARFVSLLEPPEYAASAAAGCANRYTWPVLVGDRERRDVLLSSPILLYDFPEIAAESRGDLCDAAEIDEILSLRILTLTDDEKQEARSTDPIAARIIDRTEEMPPDQLLALHASMKTIAEPESEEPGDGFVMIDGASIAKGSRVRLRPNRRADAMDMFLRDQAATVTGVFRDFDDRTYVAVTVDADPAAELHGSFGRFFYFDPGEIEPLGEARS